MPRKDTERLTRAFPIVISGPSGVGKTTLVDEIVSRDPLLRCSISTTTRPPRDGEVEGEAYFFVDTKKFEELKNGELIEWASVYGHLYGTPRAYAAAELAMGYDLVLNIDVQGGAEVKKSFPDAVLMFILPPSLEELRVRIIDRGTDYGDEIEKRMENAQAEIKLARTYDYVVVNDLLEDAVAQIGTIIESERRRRIRFDDDFFDKFDIDS